MTMTSSTSSRIMFACVAALAFNNSVARGQCQFGDPQGCKDLCESQILVHPAPGPNDGFGFAVDLDGAVMVVSAHNGAHVFRYDGYRWAWEQSFEPIFGANNSSSGVAVSGDVLAIGSEGDDEVAGSAGAVYIYRYFSAAGGAWLLDTKLLGTGVIDKLGSSVDVDGDVLAAGTRVRGVEVYRHNGSSWQWEQTVRAGGVAGNGDFGESVSIDGNVMAIGAPRDSTFGFKVGSAFIYRRTATWIQEEWLIASDGDDEDEIGHDISLRGSTVAVGAPFDDDHGVDSGAVYIFEFDGANWIERAKLTASDASSDDYFGTAVSLDGDMSGSATTLAVGRQHSVSMFARLGGAWIEQQKLSKPDVYGWDVATEDQTVVFSSVAHDPYNESVYVFLPDDSSPDCNLNENTDLCDVNSGSSEDFNDDGIPDECDDCNINGIPDFEDVANGTSFDCNTNLVPDDCDIEKGRSPDCNANFIPDECDVAVGTSRDCNQNARPDECDVGDGTSNDCSGDGVPDECDSDCNWNGVFDTCDVFSGTSEDCDGNGNPDECDPDCNANFIPDACDLASGSSLDCNNDAIPDECQDDCNRNGVDDACDLVGGVSADCNANGVLDECEAAPFFVFSRTFSPIGFAVNLNVSFPAPPADGDVILNFTASGDLDAASEYINATLNGTQFGPVFVNNAGHCSWPPETEQIVVPAGEFNDVLSAGNLFLNVGTTFDVNAADCGGLSFLTVELEYVSFGDLDCDNNDIPDDCEAPQADCNSNGVADGCDIINGTSSDCTGNGVPDDCEPDCNLNGIADSCDIADSTSTDCQGNGIPDECEPDCNSNGIADGCDIAGGTSADCQGDGIPDECESFAVTASSRYISVQFDQGSLLVAVLITGDGSDSNVACVSSYVQADGSLGPEPIFQTEDAWCKVDVHGVEIIPATSYAVQFDDGSTLSAPISITTANWGDVTSNFIDGDWEPPDGIVKILDAVAALSQFQGLPNAPPVELCDMEPQEPDGVISITDIVHVLAAFSGAGYPFAPPCGG